MVSPRRKPVFAHTDVIADVTIAKDGQEAFDKVRASMENGNRFHLIFMDVQMPNIDGIQSTKMIREMGYSAPIVALTAFAEKSNEDECMASGMDYFLPKPIRRPALKQVLKKYCATIPEEDNEGSTMQVPTVQKMQGINHVPSTSRDSSVTGRIPNGEGKARPIVVDSHSYSSGDVSPIS
jgi:osomolarity two-component system sensor histidine kinase SLN1